MKQFQSFQLSQRALAMDLQASLCFIAEIKVKIVCYKSEFLLSCLADSLVIDLDVCMIKEEL